jgi:hypothetical protein
MFPNHCHGQIGAILTAKFFGQGEAQVARLVANAACLCQQVFPFFPGQALVIKVRARPFAPMVEKTDVVVPVFQGFDLVFDKRIQLRQIVDEFLGQKKSTVLLSRLV